MSPHLDHDHHSRAGRPEPVLRGYEPADEPSWLRCRVLAFLTTAYHDDVLRARPATPPPGFGLVAVVPAMHLSGEEREKVLGILDVSVDDDLATIDTVAVHPDHRRRGLGRQLLAEARARLRAAGVPVLDAWTRDDPETLAWYRSQGFVESDHYLHVYANGYADPGEPDRAVRTPASGLRPVAVFAHADLDREAELRRGFRRVHVCRRFSTTP
ncbi:GNAT family N-acetyltransferase [Streptomyces alkaliphilus]|uniref:GNAT family N-acetyltransferase n=1 Tax=Streptomyces alkaliphilus TaxID=1472722 RepID=UPI002B1EC011|nr:GNAT family N-acetyltransferase [Streptomyces alkaliphilus]